MGYRGSCRLLGWLGADVKQIAPMRTRSSSLLETSKQVPSVGTAGRVLGSGTAQSPAHRHPLGCRPGGHLSSECTEALCSQPSLQQDDGSLTGTSSVSLPSPAETKRVNREVKQCVAFCSRGPPRGQRRGAFHWYPGRTADELNPDTWSPPYSQDSSLQTALRDRCSKTAVTEAAAPMPAPGSVNAGWFGFRWPR